MTTAFDKVQIVFGDERQPKALPLSHPKARWIGFKPESTVLPKGYTRRRGCLPLPCPIQFDRDVAVKLRDGVTVYVDIYRPVDADKAVPALVAWSPYGKQGGRGNQVLDDFPFRMGVPLSGLSELQKWEAPDPGYWVQYGYAVVNVDTRGAGKSEGNIYQFGSQEGRDGADVVDWIGAQSWCSGKVALSGNSYLSISQWYIAAERPKHLACIAPWEGFSDLYREGMALGGVLMKPSLDFGLKLLSVNAGENSWENTVQMAINHKLFGPYHDDKRANVENIDVPAYVVASWSNPIHTYGTFRAWNKLKTEKWLRIHDSWEWPDYYDETNRADLHRFFDFFLKGVDNGWETTPRVRAKLIDTANPYPLTGSEIQSTAFPLPDTRPLKLFMSESSNKGLSVQLPLSSRSSYIAKSGALHFGYEFLKDTVLCGPVEVGLSVSLADAKDSDIFIGIEKILHSGAVGQQLVVPYQWSIQSWLISTVKRLRIITDADALFYRGPVGAIRVSRRLADEKLSQPGFPVQRMEVYNPVQPGEIVHLKPPVYPIGMKFAKGEKLRVTVTGTNSRTFPPVDQAVLEAPAIENLNEVGIVTLHYGAIVDGSYVVLPVMD